MKRLLYILSVVIVFSCDSKDGWNCLQTTGSIIQQEFAVTDFMKITVHRDVELIIEEGSEYQVVIETGENLLSDIDVVVNDDRLEIFDNNTCNLVREYGVTKAYVTAPNVDEIRNSSQYEVSSIGIVNFPTIRLISEDFNEPGSFTVGDFRMQLNSNSVNAVANNISSFYLSGTTQNLYVGFFSGSGRFEGADLIAQEVTIYHRASNDIIVNPQQSLVGELYGTGNLISVNQPPNVDVEEFYIGELIFLD